MHFRPFRLPSAWAVAALLSFGLSSGAFAAGEKDKEALKLHDQAMNEDYLSVEFDKAEKKLRDAIKKCGEDACTPKVLGKLHVALGTVYGGGQGKLDEAKAEFVAAVKADPSAALDEAFTSKELEKVFKEAQAEAKKGGKPAADKPPKPPPSGEGEGEEGEGKVGGDLSHTPPSEQALNTPVPIYIEIPEDLGASKVTLRYKPFGEPKWTNLEMKKMGDGFGIEIPCKDVTVTGELKYYITAKDDQGEPVGTAGSSKEPYKVMIKNEIEGDEPALPGKQPPRRCKGKEDCVPGINDDSPECQKKPKRGDKDWGASCDEDEECKEGLICTEADPASPDKTCQEGQREGGDDGGGSKKSGPGKKNVIGLWGSLDLLLISGGEQVCSGADPSYVCFYPGTSKQFYGNPLDAQGTNGISGGFGVAGGRIALSYDREIIKAGPGTLGAGLRFGVALGGSPSSEAPPPQSAANRHSQATAFPPIHVEVRAGYTIGGSLLEKSKFRPYIFINGGLAQVNASVPVTVCDRLKEDGETPIDADEDNCAAGTATKRELDAYQITGLNFVGFGGGAVYGLHPNVGIAAEVKVMFLIPTFGIAFAPTIGPVFGF